jgi:hypothetical protein
MGSILMVIFVLVCGTYILGRVTSIAQSEKHEKWHKLLELARKRRIDELYGRENEEEGKND